MFYRRLFSADGGNGGSDTPEENQGGAGNSGGAQGGLKQGDPGYDAELQRARTEAAESRRKLREIEDKNREREEADRAAAAAAAAEQGRFKELYEGSQTEISTLKARVAELEPFQAQVTEIETARRAELVARLPEAARADYEGVSIAEIERAVKLLPAADEEPLRKSTAGGAPPAGADGSKKSPLEMTVEDLEALRASDPEGYKAALAARRQTKGRHGLFG